MWYIIKTETSTEEDLEKKFKELPYINDTYLPRYRRYLPKHSGKAKYKYCLTISGVVFIYVSKSNKEEFCKHLTNTGYLLDDEGNKYDGQPHLIRTSNPRLSLDDILELSKVSESDFTLFKIYNDQNDIERSMEKLDLVDNVTFNTLQKSYDTVCVIDGPYSQYQGVVKREPNIVNGEKHGKDNRLFCQMGIWSVKISNIRKYNYIIVREAVNGKDFPLTNTWRFIDRLLGSLQASFFPDDSSLALRTLVIYMTGRTLDAAKHEIRKVALDSEDRNEKKQTSYLSTFLEEMDLGTQGSLTALVAYFKNVKELKEADLTNIIPDIKLRPFLTPTPGKKLARNSHYAILKHDDFTEIILRLNLKSYFVNNIYLMPKGLTLTDNDFVYYAHIGIKKNDEFNGLTAFVNWSGFMHSFMQREEDDRKKFVSLLKERNVASLAEIIEEKKPDNKKKSDSVSNTDEQEVSQKCDDEEKDDKNKVKSIETFDESSSFAGFKVGIKDVDIDKTMELLIEQYNKPSLSIGLIRQLHPIAELLRKTIPAAVEMWQSPRFSKERMLLQRYVLLHKIPVGDKGKTK